MKNILNLAILLLLCTNVIAQNFNEETEKFRKNYKEDFLKSKNSPLKKDDLSYLRFFEPDSTYRVTAVFKRIQKSRPFEMPTYSDTNKTYVKYGELKFRLHGRKQSLTVYRSLSLQTLPQYRDYLFLPFKDKTNGVESYGGGRYIDLRTGDIKENIVILDFNKAYNPYCAYSDGYHCPIPPSSNHLSARIEAGEKNFGKEH
ncbi:hypothetical protein SAMN04487995_1938 [Dyadobacter koreensis]|uniref:DUF1684 domain-containing protein n=1 Tax=Dyadobacter koreensis TaxID=408657 RepID=A0A1H6TCJ7_9BACT|nr:DUF1684 domain-containing protein [Dyadobacter koreensis]SEI73532.1 hypothetical protein SAMN04487995_1938 [Dyadobacter koreensis]